MKLPSSGRVYVDTQVVIYSVEKHPVYMARVRPLWQAAQQGTIEIVTSELTLLEVLVQPLRRGDQNLARDYERVLDAPGLTLAPVDRAVLRHAAECALA